MSKPKLALTPSGYKSGKVYSILPNDATGDFDFARASVGTRVRKDGLIEEVANNVPRLDWYNSNCPSLKLEPERTNTFTYSEQFNQSVWFKSNCTITTNQIIAPDGTLTADLATSTANGGGVYRFSSWSTTEKTASIFVKKNTSSTAEIFNSSSSANKVVFNLDSGTITTEGGTMTGKIEDFGNGWYRLSAIYTATAGGTFGLKPETNESLYIWGAQLEAGSYSTSYIKTEAGTVTRLKDECYINSGIDNIINTNEGTLYFEVETPRVSTSSDFDRVVLSDQTATTDIIIFDNFNGSWRVVLTSSAGTETASIRSVQANTKIKVAFTYSASEIKVSYDGNDATTTSITYTPATTLESFKFSNAAGNGQFFQGKIHDVRYFDTVLSNAELKELTTL